jgi:hypothetical protein
MPGAIDEIDHWGNSLDEARQDNAQEKAEGSQPCNEKHHAVKEDTAGRQEGKGGPAPRGFGIPVTVAALNGKPHGNVEGSLRVGAFTKLGHGPDHRTMELHPLLEWLRRNIYSHGRRFTARQLVKNITGADLSPLPLPRHLTAKANELYGA